MTHDELRDMAKALAKAVIKHDIACTRSMAANLSAKSAHDLMEVVPTYDNRKRMCEAARDYWASSLEESVTHDAMTVAARGLLVALEAEGRPQSPAPISHEIPRGPDWYATEGDDR